MTVMFVGDKPSKYNTDPLVAFIGARCEKRLREWVKQLGLNWDECIFVNSHNPFSTAVIPEIKLAYASGAVVVALGRKAEKRLKNFKKFVLPHPSDRNRQINNKEFINQKLIECRTWLDSQKTQ